MQRGEGWKVGLGLTVLVVLMVGFFAVTFLAYGRAKGLRGPGSFRQGGVATEAVRDSGSFPMEGMPGYIEPGEPGYVAPPPSDAPLVKHEKEDIKVGIEVDYKERDPQARYKMTFDGTYVLRNAEEVPINARFVFPFPRATDAKWDTKLTVDGEEVPNAVFTRENIRWRMRLEPGETKTVAIGYSARGAETFVYELSKEGQVPDLNVTLTVTGGRGKPEVLDGTLEPSSFDEIGRQEWKLAWVYKGLVADKDISVAFPARRATGALGAALLRRLPWLAVVFTIAFAGWLWLITSLRGVTMRAAQHVAVAVCFFLFYPAVLFLSELIPADTAYFLALAAVTVMIMGYIASVMGLAFALKYVLLSLVAFLGFFGIAALAPEYTKVAVLAGAFLLVGFYMFATRGKGKPVPETPPDFSGTPIEPPQPAAPYAEAVAPAAPVYQPGPVPPEAPQIIAPPAPQVPPSPPMPPPQPPPTQ